MEIAVAEYGLPTLAEFASCAFQEHLALGISRTERLRRRKNPEDADYEKKMPQRTPEASRAAHQRHYDNKLARAMPDMPGVVPLPPSPQERSTMPRQKEGEAWGTHLPQEGTDAKVQAQIARMQLSMAQGKTPEETRTQWTAKWLWESLMRARARAREAASDVSAEAAVYEGRTPVGHIDTPERSNEPIFHHAAQEAPGGDTWDRGGSTYSEHSTWWAAPSGGSEQSTWWDGSSWTTRGFPSQEAQGSGSWNRGNWGGWWSARGW